MRTSCRRWLLPAILLVFPMLARAQAQLFTFAVDVPSTLGGSDYLQNEVVLYNGAYWPHFYGSGASFRFSALASQPNSQFLFAPAAPCDLGGTTFLPCDIVLYTAGGFAMYKSGTALGLSSDTRIDALAAMPGGDLLLSFDAPTTVGGNTYTRNDVVRLSGIAFSLYDSGASVLHIPDSANLSGLEYALDGSLYLSFSTPTALPGLTALPGDIVQFKGGTYNLYFRDASFPKESAMTDFALWGSPGAVPTDAYTSGTPLKITKSGNNIALTWGASCSQNAADYSVYEGTLGSWYSHASSVCTTGGALATTLTPGSGNKYYLVTANNGAYEGSYGRDSQGIQIPRASAPCNGLASDMIQCW